MSELAIRNGHNAEVAVPLPVGAVASLAQWAAEARAAASLAESLCKTSFVPEHFRGKPAEATAAILTGHELGMSPMASLRSIFVIKGTPGMYAKSMVAVVQSRGHEVWVEEQTQTRAIVCGRRKGSSETARVIWDVSRAKIAELTGNSQYRKNPQNMFVARGQAEVCRQIAADALHGIPYAVEELDDEYVAADETPASKPKSRKMQRTAVPAPEPELEEPTPPAEDPITPDQLKALHTLMGNEGYGDRETDLAYLSQQAGRDVTTSKELTKSEAIRIIDRLQFPDEPPVEDDVDDTGVAEPIEPNFDNDGYVSGDAR